MAEKKLYEISTQHKIEKPTLEGEVLIMCNGGLTFAEMRQVDAVEVVHGKWIKHPNVEIVDGKRISNYECSECCCFYRTHENYCGYCGAKMDGDGSD